MGVVKTQVGVNLDPPIVARLDSIGKQYGLSRSAVARVLLTSVLELTDSNLRRLIVPDNEPAAVAEFETPRGVRYAFGLGPGSVEALTGRVANPFGSPE